MAAKQLHISVPVCVIVEFDEDGGNAHVVSTYPDWEGAPTHAIVWDPQAERWGDYRMAVGENPEGTYDASTFLDLAFDRVSELIPTELCRGE